MLKKESCYKANVIARQKHCTGQSSIWKPNVDRKRLGDIHSDDAYLIKSLFSSNISRKNILKQIDQWQQNCGNLSLLSYIR